MNTILNLWRGNAGLAKTYWLWGGLPSIPWGIALSLVDPGSNIALLVVLALIVYYVIVYVGIWRAASRYEGTKVWAILAKVLVSIGAALFAIAFMLSFFSSFFNTTKDQSLVQGQQTISAAPLAQSNNHSTSSEDSFESEFQETMQMAKRGDASAQSQLAFMYSASMGVQQDDAQALYWYKKAAEQGNAIAQHNLGFMYKNGQGVQQDYAQAFYWFKKAAEQGNAHSQSFLGSMYENGQGVRQDYAQASSWYRKAAEQGEEKAQFKLGLSYYDGQDYAQAFNWLQKAAVQGQVYAQYNLGVMYFNGEGVRQSPSIAKEWFGKACDNGLQEGCEGYKKLNQEGMR